MSESDPSGLQELSSLRKKATEYVLQQNYKAALPLFDQTLRLISDWAHHNELNLSEDDLYVIHCARCLCVLYERFDEAPAMLQALENSFCFRMPLLYFMFCKEHFERDLLQDTKEYSIKFLRAYCHNLFGEKGKVYYWIGTNIAIKYEQFSSIKELANKILEQLSCKENSDENAGLLREIFVTLEEVLFYSQSEDCIKKSFKETSLSDNAGIFRIDNKSSDKKDDSGLILENEKGLSLKSSCRQSPQTHDRKVCNNKIVQTDNCNKSKEISSQTDLLGNRTDCQTQTELMKLISVGIGTQCEADMVENMADESHKEMVNKLELQKEIIRELEGKYKKLHENSVVESAKWEVRFEILENELVKLKERHEMGIKQIATLQAHLKSECVRNCNLQQNIYVQYGKKCKNMIRDLNNIVPYLTLMSIPTSTECLDEIKAWQDELCKVDYCRNILNAHEMRLKTDFENATFPIGLPDIPDCPVEVRDILHDNFRSVMLYIIKNESVKPFGATAAAAPPYHLYYPPMMCNAQMAPGFISNPFQQPTILRGIPSPMLPQPPAMINKTKEPLRAEPPPVDCTNNKSEPNSSSSSSTDTPSFEWLFQNEDAPTEPDETPLPLSSLMKMSRHNTNNNGIKTNKNTETGDFLNLNKLSEAVVEFGSENFSYLIKNMPMVSEVELLAMLRELKAKDDGNFDGLNRETILNKIRAQYKEKIKHEKLGKCTWNAVDSVCYVCKKRFVGNGGTVVTLHCNHKFHDDCLKVNSENASSCPSCRGYVYLSNEYPPLS